MRLRGDLMVGFLLVSACLAALGFWFASERPLGFGQRNISAHPAWHPPDPATIPAGADGDLMRFGRQVFNDTPRFAAKYTGDRLSCSDCHIGGGTVPYASPMIGIAPLFPMYLKRAGRMVSLEGRIQECMVRSQNGRPLPEDSRQMKGLVAYIQWLSPPDMGGKPFWGRGLVNLPLLTPNIERGAKIYKTRCAVCHGEQGQGIPSLMPPLWGPGSFNDGAGMSHPAKMARFVQHNMPKTDPGSLTAQEAYDVAGYIDSHPRPAFNTAYKEY